jgi:predicted ATP-dependent Lon-type protease
VKAVKKTVSGFVKLIYLNGQLSKEEVAELVELSLMRASRPLARHRLIEKRSRNGVRSEVSVYTAAT